MSKVAPEKEESIPTTSGGGTCPSFRVLIILST
jgi:hypothetical protein